MAGANGRHKTGSLSNNELELVNTMANEVVVNALANGNMQHPDVPQDSHSISSDVVAFFRAQGASVTFELPLPANATASRTADVPQLASLQFNSDFPITQLIAGRLGLHPGFDPRPSVEMLIRDLAQRAFSIQALLPLKEPLPIHEWNPTPHFWFMLDSWFFNVDNPNWGNNAEASSSAGPRRPRPQLLNYPTGMMMEAPSVQNFLRNDDAM
jgi:hypothetical protein